MKLLLLFFTLAFCAGCQSSGVKSASVTATVRDGSSHERAIQIKAKSHSEGLQAEHDWLRQNLPGSHLAEGGTNSAGEEIIFLPHRTETSGNAIFSVYTMQLSDGRVIDVFFDQSSYFGK